MKWKNVQEISCYFLVTITTTVSREVFPPKADPLKGDPLYCKVKPDNYRIMRLDDSVIDTCLWIEMRIYLRGTEF